MKIILTGSNGFIGKNFYRTLRSMGHDVLAVEIDACWDFLDEFSEWDDVDLVLHQGAISNTTERDIDKIYRYNILFSIELFERAMRSQVPVKFASSASVYGNLMSEVNPLNYYAMSKLTVDMWIKDNMNQFPLIQSFRYFNVYGEGEDFKVTQGQASPISTFVDQAKKKRKITLFEGSDKFCRDFICVRDVVSLVLKNDNPSGVYDLGTSNAISFWDVAKLIADKYDAKITTRSFPQHLKNKYQVYTRSKKHFGNYDFISVEDYVENCLD